VPLQRARAPTHQLGQLLGPDQRGTVAHPVDQRAQAQVVGIRLGRVPLEHLAQHGVPLVGVRGGEHGVAESGQAQRFQQGAGGEDPIGRPGRVEPRPGRPARPGRT